jgi:hypothetical protein
MHDLFDIKAVETITKVEFLNLYSSVFDLWGSEEPEDKE